MYCDLYITHCQRTHSSTTRVKSPPFSTSYSTWSYIIPRPLSGQAFLLFIIYSLHFNLPFIVVSFILQFHIASPYYSAQLPLAYSSALYLTEYYHIYNPGTILKNAQILFVSSFCKEEMRMHWKIQTIIITITTKSTEKSDFFWHKTRGFILKWDFVHTMWQWRLSKQI